MKRIVAAALFMVSTSLLAQPGGDPSKVGATTGTLRPTPTPTRAAGAAGGLAGASKVGLPGAPVLHLEGKVSSLGCGKPLAFEIVVKNIGGTPFTGSASLRASGSALNHPPQLEGSVRSGIGGIPAGGSQAVHLTATPVKVDCAAPQTFLVVITPAASSGLPHPEWDRDALELTTAPPTNCAAGASSQRVPKWSPKA